MGSVFHSSLHSPWEACHLFPSSYGIANWSTPSGPHLGSAHSFFLHRFILLVHNKDVLDKTIGLTFEFALQGEAIESIQELLKTLFILMLMREEPELIQSSILFQNKSLGAVIQKNRKRKIFQIAAKVAHGAHSSRDWGQLKSSNDVAGDKTLTSVRSLSSLQRHVLDLTTMNNDCKID